MTFRQAQTGKVRKPRSDMLFPRYMCIGYHFALETHRYTQAAKLMQAAKKISGHFQCQGSIHRATGGTASTARVMMANSTYLQRSGGLHTE
jgi:hypothetical protein